MAEISQNNKYGVSDKLDMLEHSEKNLSRALEIREKLLGPGHKLTELVRSELASLHAGAFPFPLHPPHICKLLPTFLFSFFKVYHQPQDVMIP